MEIDLGFGRATLIDAADAHLLANRTWRAYKSARDRTFYARAHTSRTRKKKITLLLHRVIIGAQAGEIVDHVNGDGLDNRRCNLRLCTPFESASNRSPCARFKSKYKGVDPHEGMWRARITSNRKPKLLGEFKTEIEAALMYNFAALIYHGDFARLNVMEIA